MTNFFGYKWWTSLAPADVLFSKGIPWICFFFSLAFVLAYVTLGSSLLFDGNTLLIVLLQLTLIAVGARYIKTDPVRVMLILYALILSLYAYPRLLQYLISVETVWMAYGAGNSVGGMTITPQMVNHALLYQMGCVMMILAGAFLASCMIRSGNGKEVVYSSKIKLLSLLVLFVFYTCIRSDSFQEKLWHVFGWGLSLYNFHGLLEIIFSMDMLFFMVLALLYHQSNGFQKQFALLLVLTIIFLLFKIYAGSRGGGVLTLFFLASIILPSGRQEIPVAKILAYAVCVIAISVASFSVATQNRETPKIGETGAGIKHFDRDGKPSISRDVVNRPPVSENAADQYFVYAQGGRGGVYSILNRMGAYIDASVVVTNLPPVEHLKNKFMTVDYALKSTINIALPGVYYECCVINTSFLPPFIFGQRNEDMLYTPGYYESTFWTPHGFAYVTFDTPYDIVFMLVSGWLLGTAYLVCTRTSCRVFALPFFALLGIYMFFLFQGLDAYLVDLQKFGLSAFVAVLFIQLANKAGEAQQRWGAAIVAKFKRQKSPTVAS